MIFGLSCAKTYKKKSTLFSVLFFGGSNGEGIEVPQSLLEALENEEFESVVEHDLATLRGV